MVDAAGTTKYTYTAGNQLLTEDGPFASDTVTNIYLNRLRTALSLQQPTGLWTNGFAYDAARRLTNLVSKAGSFADEYSTGVGGASGFSSHLVKRLLLPNLAAITNDYDATARLLATHLRTSAGVLTNKHEYGYNQAGQRTNETRVDARTVAYAYDSIGQLKVADSSVSTEDRGYAYDSAWNLNYRTNNGVASTFTVDIRNQLTSTPVGSASYDGNGNLVSYYHRYGSGGLTRTCAYDDENRLVSVYSGTTYRTDFGYDGLGRMRKRTTFAWNGSSWGVSAVVAYIYDGWRPIQERDGSNVPTVSYTRGTDLSGTLEGAGGIGGLLARSSGYSGGNWTSHAYYHADGNGNITRLLATNQSVVASYRYDPFGNTISKSGTLADANVYRFSSKEIHLVDTMGSPPLYYYGYRFYEPSLQRWMNRDPVFDKGFSIATRVKVPADEPNTFLFVRNGSISGVDPFGLRLVAQGGFDDESLQAVGDAVGRCFAIAHSRQKEYEEFGRQRRLVLNADKWYHCVTSCEMTRACGSAMAWALGELRELWQRTQPGHDPTGTDTAQDKRANRDGRKCGGCKEKRSCEECCEGLGYQRF